MRSTPLGDGEREEGGEEAELVLAAGIPEQAAPVGVDRARAAPQAMGGLLAGETVGRELKDAGLAEAEAMGGGKLLDHGRGRILAPPGNGCRAHDEGFGSPRPGVASKTSLRYFQAMTVPRTMLEK